MDQKNEISLVVDLYRVNMILKEHHQFLHPCRFQSLRSFLSSIFLLHTALSLVRFLI